MANKKFKYKASGVDQLIAGIILLACASFILLIYLDMKNTTEPISVPEHSDIQDLIEQKQLLEEEIDRIKNEQNTER